MVTTQCKNAKYFTTKNFSFSGYMNIHTCFQFLLLFFKKLIFFVFRYYDGDPERLFKEAHVINPNNRLLKVIF